MGTILKNKNEEYRLKNTYNMNIFQKDHPINNIHFYVLALQIISSNPYFNAFDFRNIALSFVL